MNIYAVICTRSKDVNNITLELLNFLNTNSIRVNLIVNPTSIFKAYSNAFKLINPNDEDIVIFCHDDIQITSKGPDLIKILKEELENPKICFIGPAGTRFLGQDAVWWNWDNHKMGHHSGLVMHLNEKKQPYPTFYGPYDNVAVLDGVFLAAKAKNIRSVGLQKPEYFEGEWDFYDIHYTTTALKLGMVNRAVPITMIHHSSGQLVGRDSWHKNRQAFIDHNKLPISIYGDIS